MEKSFLLLSLERNFEGILGPPDQLKIDVYVSNTTLRLSWIAPPSYDVSPAAIFHYVLSNNVSNGPKIIKSSCAPSMPCTASLDLRDPLLLMSPNTSILEYNGTIEFTYYAVNGAGNGNATTYPLRPSPGNRISTHPVPTAASGIANTNVATNIIQTNNTNAIVTTSADPEHGSKTNEYIQTLCVTQQDDPYHVVVPLELRKLPHGHHNEPGEHQTQPPIENKVLITHHDTIFL
ncbi:hypothetical protein EMCRGX_G016991 [Ephydatia muelleri]